MICIFIYLYGHHELGAVVDGAEDGGEDVAEGGHLHGPWHHRLQGRVILYYII